MRTFALDVLACPECGGDLELERPEKDDDGSIDAGLLVCSACARSFEIRNGVPRFVAAADMKDEGKRATASAFGYAWTTYPKSNPYSDDQIRDWFEPLDEGDFRGKIVVDAGCGSGGFAAWVADAGAAAVVALDVSDSVDVAQLQARGRENMVAVQADIYRPPLKPVFDVAYSIGVIHHLPDPRAGFLRVSEVVRPGGRQFVWVYGWEGNAFVRRVVDPLRRHVAARLPYAVTRWGLAFPLAAILWLVLRMGYAPGSGPVRARLFPFFRSYLSWLAATSFVYVHGVVFDQLVAPTTHYLKRDEVREWFGAGGLSDVTLRFRNANSWAAVGTRQASPV